MQSPSSWQWNYIDLFQLDSIVFFQWSFIDCINIIQLICWFWKNEITLFFQWNSIDLFNGCSFICSMISNRLFYFEETQLNSVVFQLHSIVFFNGIPLFYCVQLFFVLLFFELEQINGIALLFFSNRIQLFVSIEFRGFWCSIVFHWFSNLKTHQWNSIVFNWIPLVCFIGIPLMFFNGIPLICLDLKKQWKSIDFVFLSMEFHLCSMKIHWVLLCVFNWIPSCFRLLFLLFENTNGLSMSLFLNGIPLFFNIIQLLCFVHCNSIVFSYLKKTTWNQWKYIDCGQWNSNDCVNVIPLSCFQLNDSDLLNLKNNWISLIVFNGIPPICSIKIIDCVFQLNSIVFFEFETHNWNCIDLFQWNFIGVSMNFHCFF